MPQAYARRQARWISSILTCFLLAAPAFALDPSPPGGALQASVNEAAGDSLHTSAEQAAAILDVTPNVRRLMELASEGGPGSANREVLLNKSVILRKVLLAYLEVRQTSDSIDTAIDYTYDAIDKVTRKQQQRIALANIANFTQFGVLLDVGAVCRLNHWFTSSGILTCVAAGDTLLLSTLGLELGRLGKSKDARPPNLLATISRTDLPEKARLPDFVDKFLNSNAPGAARSRRDQLLETWKTRFHADASNPELAAAYAASSPNRSGESLGLLRTRLTLLYSLNALAEEFDKELLALLVSTQAAPESNLHPGEAAGIKELSESANEAARLLNIQSEARQLMSCKTSQISDDEKLRLQVLLLEKTLIAALSVRDTVDRIDQEKHYDFDVLLAQMSGERDRNLRRCTTVNFTQTGVLKAVAGHCFLDMQSKAGTDLVLTFNGLGVLLSTAALKYASGGRRKLDSDPNVLADVLDLAPPAKYNLPPVIRSYLNDVAPGSGTTLTRRQQLVKRWQDRRIFNPPEAPCLAAMPALRDQRCVTIKLVQQRLRMLFDVMSASEGLDTELLELLQTIDCFQQDDPLQLAVTQRALIDTLQVRKVTNSIDDQLAQEYTAQQEMIARSQLGIELNNTANFMQSGVLGLIGGGLTYEGKSVAANTLDLISGSSTLLLCSLALLQGRGGKRREPSSANVLGQILNLPTPAEHQLPPKILAYIDAVPPGSAKGMTRQQELIDRWGRAGVLTINLKRRGTLETLAANGPTYRPKCETIKLIQNRIVMLHDVHTLVESLDGELVTSLNAVN